MVAKNQTQLTNKLWPLTNKILFYPPVSQLSNHLLWQSFRETTAQIELSWTPSVFIRAQSKVLTGQCVWIRYSERTKLEWNRAAEWNGIRRMGVTCTFPRSGDLVRIIWNSLPLCWFLAPTLDQWWLVAEARASGRPRREMKKRPNWGSSCKRSEAIWTCSRTRHERSTLLSERYDWW